MSQIFIFADFFFFFLSLTMTVNLYFKGTDEQVKQICSHEVTAKIMPFFKQQVS